MSSVSFFKKDCMSEQEKHLEHLESEFPAVSGLAFAAARQHVLTSGHSVVQSENGSIYEVFPDGRRSERA